MPFVRDAMNDGPPSEAFGSCVHYSMKINCGNSAVAKELAFAELVYGTN